ncbi:hypothetical protein M3A49_16340 [Paraburkholderia sp. CNPSo 3076]|nr:hypothetical protein [Paraburkholderia sp. CNPSo 3076]MCX5541050.1 hypothetical protein [Paraburkholderia sp. CNPSo 3076]
MNHRSHNGESEQTVLGPFHRADICETDFLALEYDFVLRQATVG